MIIKRLYLKILFAFLGILLITMLLTIGLFMMTAGSSYKSCIDRQHLAKLEIFKVMAQKELDRHKDLPAEKNSDFVELLNTCTQIFGIKLWLTQPGGPIIWQNFEGPVDFLSGKDRRQVHHDNGIIVYHYMLQWQEYYAVIPIDYRNQGLQIHLFLDKGTTKHYKVLFFIGLFVIVLTATLMLIPMISYITRRINRLNLSALEFAGGNLSVRTDIKGDDEIAKLGDTFNRMADRLERLIGNSKELTANVSHELRSPLARLRVSKELIIDKLEQQGITDDAVIRLLNNMESDIGDLDTLIEEALALSKMNYQESALAPETFRFSEFIKSMMAPYQPLLSSNNLTLDLDIKDFGKARQDKALIKSVFSNLLDNAIKYSPPGTCIHVCAGTVSPKGLEFSVTNTCAPMRQEDLNRLFNPFFRIPGQKASGTGLGLAIAQQQIQRCQGTIRAEHNGREICLAVYIP